MDKSVIEMSKAIREINDHITGISVIVKELHEESIGKNAIKKEGIFNFETVIKVIGVILTIGILLIGYFNLSKQNKEVEQKINNFGVPFVKNSRGQFLALPDSTVIQLFHNDSVSYTIKKVK